MEKQLICIICPRGCSLTATVGHKIKVKGNACPKGEKYAVDELTNPLRTVTSTVRVDNIPFTMVSVKTKEPIPKKDMAEAMKKIRSATVSAPIKIGDVVIKNVCGTDIVATQEIK
jgi:CxxC motif-containing protein